jgi:flagellar biogenesis protein FliO
MPLYMPEDSSPMPEVVPPDIGASFLKMFSALALLVVLMYATYWVLKRMMHYKMQRGNRDASIHVVEKKMLSPKTMLYVVEIEGKKVLIAESHLEVRRLEVLEEKHKKK